MSETLIMLDKIFPAVKTNDLFPMFQVLTMKKAAIVLALIAVASAAIPSRASGVTFSKGARLIGGEEAEDREFPFVVSLQRSIGGELSHYCAGVIYDEWRILTAAICLVVLARDPSDYAVVAGANDIVNLRGDEQLIRVSDGKIHENFSISELDYNIGIVILAEPLVFNQNIQPIRLAIPTIEPSGEAQVVGWGTLDEETMPNKLHKVNMNVIDRDVCKRDYSIIGLDITENFICASAPRRFTCDGDSGGPLIAKDEARRPYLAGIVSWTISPCGYENLPSLFNNIPVFRSWLDKNLN